MARIGTSDLAVFPLALGGNVFGWTADRDASFAVLDAFTAGGGNFVDTADAYSAWVPGNSGGESETIIGEWLAARKPAGFIVATKVAKHPEFRGLSADNVRRAAEASLGRLGVETIDLYYAHEDDTETPLEESVGAFGQLISDGLIRYAALSNFSGERTREWIRVADELGVPRPVALQPHYNLVHRTETETDLVPVAEEFDLSLVPYYALASGFLTGKYRSADPDGQSSPRAGTAAAYATPAGLAVIDARADRFRPRRVDHEHGARLAPPAAHRRGADRERADDRAGPDLLASATLELSPADIERLNDVAS